MLREEISYDERDDTQEEIDFSDIKIPKSIVDFSIFYQLLRAANASINNKDKEIVGSFFSETMKQYEGGDEVVHMVNAIINHLNKETNDINKIENIRKRISHNEQMVLDYPLISILIGINLENLTSSTVELISPTLYTAYILTILDKVLLKLLTKMSKAQVKELSQKAMQNLIMYSSGDKKAKKHLAKLIEESSQLDKDVSNIIADYLYIKDSRIELDISLTLLSFLEEQNSELQIDLSTLDITSLTAMGAYELYFSHCYGAKEFLIRLLTENHKGRDKAAEFANKAIKHYIKSSDRNQVWEDLFETIVKNELADLDKIAPFHYGIIERLDEAVQKRLIENSENSENTYRRLAQEAIDLGVDSFYNIQFLYHAMIDPGGPKVSPMELSIDKISQDSINRVFSYTAYSSRGSSNDVFKALFEAHPEKGKQLYEAIMTDNTSSFIPFTRWYEQNIQNTEMQRRLGSAQSSNSENTWLAYQYSEATGPSWSDDSLFEEISDPSTFTILSTISFLVSFCYCVYLILRKRKLKLEKQKFKNKSPITYKKELSDIYSTY